MTSETDFEGFERGAGGAPKPIVYVREIDTANLPSDLAGKLAEARGGESDAPAYAVHDAEGNPIAIFADRDLAFAAARLHDMAPVSAH